MPLQGAEQPTRLHIPQMDHIAMGAGYRFAIGMKDDCPGALLRAGQAAVKLDRLPGSYTPEIDRCICPAGCYALTIRAKGQRHNKIAIDRVRIDAQPTLGVPQ